MTLCDQLYQIPARNVQLAAEAWKVTLQSSSLQRLMEQVQQVTEVVTPRQQEEVGEGEQEGEGQGDVSTRQDGGKGGEGGGTREI